MFGMGRRRKAWLVGGSGRRVDRGRKLPGYHVRFNEYAIAGHIKHRSKTFDSQSAARQWVKQYNARSDLGELGQVIPVSFAEAVIEFLGACSVLAPGTIRQYTGTYDLFDAQFPGALVCDLTGSTVDKFIAMRTTKASETTAAKHFRHLRTLLAWCVKRGYAVNNATDDATRRPSGGATRSRPSISDDDLERLIEALETEDRRLAVWLAMTTGLDRGVIQNLNAEQVDADNCCIRIRRPKTRRSKVAELTVPLHPLLLPPLLARRDETSPLRPLLRGLTHQGDDRDWWKRARDAAGLKGLIFRDLRAVASSRMQRLGKVSLADVQKMLGHSTIEVTARHYAIPDSRVAEALRLLPLPGLQAASAQTTG